MLNQIASYNQSLWIVMAIIYLIVHIKFVDEWTAILYFDCTGIPICYIPSFRFITRYGDMLFLNPLQPWCFAIRGSWGMLEGIDESSARVGCREILRFRKYGIFLQIMSTAAFFVFFILAPLMTVWSSLNQAIIIFSSLYSVLMIGLAVLLNRFGPYLNMTGRDRLFLWLECLICPAYLAALPKIIGWKTRLKIDLPTMMKSRWSMR